MWACALDGSHCQRHREQDDRHLRSLAEVRLPLHRAGQLREMFPIKQVELRFLDLHWELLDGYQVSGTPESQRARDIGDPFVLVEQEWGS